MIIPLGLQLQVHDLIRAHISKKPTSREILLDNPLLRSSSSNRSVAIKDLDEQQRSLVHNSSANEKILLRKSWILRCQQQEWQVTFSSFFSFTFFQSFYKSFHILVYFCRNLLKVKRCWNIAEVFLHIKKETLC